MKQYRFAFPLLLITFLMSSCQDKVLPTCRIDSFAPEGSNVNVKATISGDSVGDITFTLRQVNANKESSQTCKKTSSGVYTMTFTDVYPNQVCSISAADKNSQIGFSNPQSFNSAMLFEVAGVEYDASSKEMVLRGGLNSSITGYIPFDTNDVHVRFSVVDASGNEVAKAQGAGAIPDVFVQKTKAGLLPGADYSVVLFAQPQSYPPIGASSIFKFTAPQ